MRFNVRANSAEIQVVVVWRPGGQRSQLWVNTGSPAEVTGTSAAGARADVIGSKPDIGTRMSAVGGKADVPATWP